MDLPENKYLNFILEHIDVQPNSRAGEKYIYYNRRGVV